MLSPAGVPLVLVKSAYLAYPSQMLNMLTCAVQVKGRLGSEDLKKEYGPKLVEFMEDLPATGHINPKTVTCSMEGLKMKALETS